jgi:hypothetical protein
MMASAPRGFSAAAARAYRTSGSIQCHDVAAITRSNDEPPGSQSSNGAVITFTSGHSVRFSRASAARASPNSTQATRKPRRASATVAWPVPQPTSSTRAPGWRPAPSTMSSNSRSG